MTQVESGAFLWNSVEGAALSSFSLGGIFTFSYAVLTMFSLICALLFILSAMIECITSNSCLKAPPFLSFINSSSVFFDGKRGKEKREERIEKATDTKTLFARQTTGKEDRKRQSVSRKGSASPSNRAFHSSPFHKGRGMAVDRSPLLSEEKWINSHEMLSNIGKGAGIIDVTSMKPLFPLLWVSFFLSSMTAFAHPDPRRGNETEMLTNRRQEGDELVLRNAELMEVGDGEVKGQLSITKRMRANSPGRRALFFHVLRRIRCVAFGALASSVAIGLLLLTISFGGILSGLLAPLSHAQAVSALSLGARLRVLANGANGSLSGHLFSPRLVGFMNNATAFASSLADIPAFGTQAFYTAINLDCVLAAGAAIGLPSILYSVFFSAYYVFFAAFIPR